MRTPVLLLLAALAALSQQQQPSIPYTLRPMYDLVNDYGNTRRYAAENQKLAPPAAGESRVVFMGDSITDAWGRGGFASTAPFFPGKPYVNRGISGQVTAQMLLGFYPAAGESRVVFMGDSITHAWGRGGFASTAPFFPGKPYVNRGISGQVTAQMLLRF